MLGKLSEQPGPYYGEFGGRFVPEALVAALDELEAEYRKALDDPGFRDELARLHREYVGRPSPLTEVTRFAQHCGGEAGNRVFLKREDLNHTGSHKINNVLGQALLVKRMGKTRVIAETGAGQHGVATATAAALLGLECVVYMGEEDTRRQALNVARMRLLGATVVPVEIGARTLKDAINEAFRDWVANVETTHYLLGTVTGPHPFPEMVREFHRIIGEEAREQIQERIGRLPDALAACVGGGSNAIGLFNAFLDDTDVAIYGFEAGGEGIRPGLHAARFSGGSPGVLHGTRSYVLQDDDGQTMPTRSISAGLDYPSVGPAHAWLNDIGRATYRPILDTEAMDAFRILCHTEGIIPAIESSHALAGAIQVGQELAAAGKRDQVILVNLSGRGDKDVATAARWFGLLDDAAPQGAEGDQ
ncbi:tryptophan synthase subunit beta [Xylanimonas protaetiae]|uniref:tryptophan synthase subunit beta n=1 Tax=Xylanimonas protaetiae TaxID=2509457 RepID=UPI001F5DEF3C|nr:tryptophan synthase subunit beta [Xylanimonas protaetiae]